MLGRLFAVYLLLAPIQDFVQEAEILQAPCVLEGTLIDFATAEPVRKAKVLLAPSTGIAAGQMATTDSSGHFRFENIPEGNYELTGERTGYLKSEFGVRRPSGSGTPLRLKAGDKLNGLTLKLARCPVITGRVSDETGEPITRALVYAVSRDWIHGQLGYFRSHSIWTNDAGEYRIFNLRLGRYYRVPRVRLNDMWRNQEARRNRWFGTSIRVRGHFSQKA